MNARPLLGLAAIAGFSTVALAQEPGIQFEATDRATFIYVQGESLSRTASFNASTVVHINAGFIISGHLQNKIGSFLGLSVSSGPRSELGTSHSTTMRAYWEPDPSGKVSVLPLSSAGSSLDKTTVFRSNIIHGDDRRGMSLRLTAISFTAN